jgi:hypothetical protein
MVSPTKLTLEQNGFRYPCLHAMLALRLQNRRLNKKLGVLNEDGVYLDLRSELEMEIPSTLILYDY